MLALISRGDGKDSQPPKADYPALTGEQGALSRTDSNTDFYTFRKTNTIQNPFPNHTRMKLEISNESNNKLQHVHN